MLNYETLLSSYDDKLTLMQWLKNVEAALKDASAVSFNVNKRGDATLTFSVVFEDGSEIESNPITLQQGESVQSAYIQNGHLHLVLTNGDDLDAGNMFEGDITLSGNLTAAGVHATGVKTSVIQQNDASGIDFFASEVSFNNGVRAQGGITSDASIKTPVLTSDEAQIIAQKPVVEVMTGYSYANIGSTKIEKSVSYAGVAKNGNKLTIAYAFKVKVIGAIDALVNLCDFTLPIAVRNKLIPAALGGYSDVLDFKQVPFYQYATTASMATAQIFKTASGIRLSFYPSSLTQNIEYYGRIEVTFLLSENLAA